MRHIYYFLDFIFGCVSFTSVLELSLLVYNGNLVLSNIDNGIKISSAIVGLMYFILRIYFFYHKSKVEISYLQEQKTELELKNKEHEVKNFLFAKDFAEMKNEEFEFSKNRLKK
jgi:hypothetical protein